MKKLSISFILLFGFFVLIPQNVLADLIRGPMWYKQAQAQKEKMEKDKASLQCVNNKKEKLSQRYLGKDIEIKSCIGDLATTNNKYFIENFGEETTPNNLAIVREIDVVLGSERTSKHNNCHEYINFNESCADITNVPPGSYLKYLPENNVVKVISPADEDYKNIVKSVTEKFLCLYNKKLNLSQEHTETTLKPKSSNEVGEHFKETGLIYYYVYKDKNPFGKQSGGGVGRNNIWTHELESVIFQDEQGCKEYVYVGNDIYYDVTNIPPYSYFKYIPKTREMKVLFPETDSYKQQIRDNIKDIESKTKELQGDETLKNTRTIVRSFKKLRKNLLGKHVSHDWMLIQNFIKDKRK